MTKGIRVCECLTLHRSARARVCVWFVFNLLTECVRLVSQRGLTACLFVCKLVKTRYGAFFVLPLCRCFLLSLCEEDQC